MIFPEIHTYIYIYIYIYIHTISFSEMVLATSYTPIKIVDFQVPSLIFRGPGWPPLSSSHYKRSL